MSQQSAVLSLMAALWLLAALGTILIRVLSKRRESGLVWAYLANLWLLHWPGAAIYVLPWYSPVEYATVLAGFEQSLYGVVGFGLGAALLAPLMVRLFEKPGAPRESTGERPDSLLPATYMIVGVLGYAVLSPLLGGIPTASAMATAVTQLVIVGICLRCWHGWFTHNKWLYYSALLLAGLIPFATMLGQGFLGYGAAAVMTVLCFAGSFIRPRWKVALAGVLVAYLGFSAYVTYMRDRSEIRRVVWGGESMGNRLHSILSMVRNAELFDPYNRQHLQRIDLRLNQNYLVGAAVEMLDSGARDYARGETVGQAVTALVPRALWPDKPVYAGSPGVVSRYTGLSFAAGTSVGIGQVMEFYINFGTLGVLAGFLILGTLVGMFDAWAAERLWAGDWMHFAMWFLAGIGFIQAGGSLVEVFSTVSAGLLAALLVNRHVIPIIQRGRAERNTRTVPLPAPGEPAP
ncbi:MAG: hypothetical protein ACRENP_20160 [Longimicrobiales bacterium]